MNGDISGDISGDSNGDINGSMQVWSKHPPTGVHKLPSRSTAPASSDPSSKDSLEGLAADEVKLLRLCCCIYSLLFAHPTTEDSGLSAAFAELSL